MAKKILLPSGMLVMALAFGLITAGCDTGGGGSGSNDPISVDLSLPAIQSVADFSGAFVASESEAKALLTDTVVVIGTITSQTGGEWSQNSVSSARAVHQEPYAEIFDHDTSILPGAIVTGFVQGNLKYSVADENNPGPAKGDYQEITMRSKLGVEFSNVTSNSLTINGKYAFDQYQYMKSSIVSLDPVKAKTTIKGTGDNGYVFSVSKNGKGLKLVMKLQAKLDTTVDDEVNMDNLDSMYSTYKFTIDIYDNDNVKQEQYSKVFNKPSDVFAYLGVEL